MLKIALGAEFNSEKMFKDVAELASQYKGVQLHTHVAENPVRKVLQVLVITSTMHALLRHVQCKSCLSRRLA